MGKTILILGGDGMAGNMLKTYLEEKGYDVFATSRRKNEERTVHFDVLENHGEMENILRRATPDFVVNCIGVLNQSAEENKAGAVLVNSFLPHYLDSLAIKHNFKLIHISTDCVFSGKMGSYSETDFPDALSFYGRTKSLGELNNGRSLTFRTSIVGPDINEKGIGLFNWFMRQRGEIKGFSNVIWTGVTTLELAKAIEKAFDMNITGLYHLVSNKKINKYELLLLFRKYTGKNIDIKEDGSYVSDKSLVNNRKDFDFNIPGYEEIIKEMCEWIKRHKEKYRQVFLYKEI